MCAAPHDWTFTGWRLLTTREGSTTVSPFSKSTPVARPVRTARGLTAETARHPKAVPDLNRNENEDR